MSPKMGVRTSNSPEAPTLAEMKPHVSFSEAGNQDSDTEPPATAGLFLTFLWPNCRSLLISTPGSILSAQLSLFLPKRNLFSHIPEFASLPPEYPLHFWYVLLPVVLALPGMKVSSAAESGDAGLLLRAAGSSFIMDRFLLSFILKPVNMTGIINEREY